MTGYDETRSSDDDDDVAWTALSILVGCIAMVAAYQEFPFAGASLIALFGALVAHIPFIYFVLLQGLDPERLSASNRRS